MLVRLVKLEFLPEHADRFAAFFEGEAEGIRRVPGCLSVRAFRDRDEPNRFFTQSVWESPEALEAYRASEFFRNNWRTVKAWFAAAPVAWSTETLSPEN